MVPKRKPTTRLSPARPAPVPATRTAPQLKRTMALAVVCLGVAGAILLTVVLATRTDDEPLEPQDSAALAPPDVPRDSVPEAVASATSIPIEVEGFKREALQVAENLVARFPDSAEAQHLLALLLKALRQTDDALASWRKCLELAPGHTRARAGFARVAIDQGDDELAAATLQQGLAEGCSSPDIYHVLATSLMNLGRFPEAARALEESLAVFPQSPRSWMLLGQTQIQQGEFPPAEASLKKAIELKPEYTDAYYALATASARQANHQAAAKYRQRFGELKARDRQLEDRLALTPDVDTMRQRTAATLGGAASVLIQEGKRVEAERFLCRASLMAPEMAEPHKTLAALYQSQGRLPEALAVQSRLVELEPNNVVGYVNLAGLAARLGDKAAAEKSLRQAIGVQPDAALAYACLARLYLGMGRPIEAREAAHDAVRLEPSPEGYLLLASVCQQLQDSTGAAVALIEAEKLSKGTSP